MSKPAFKPLHLLLFTLLLLVSPGLLKAQSVDVVRQSIRVSPNWEKEQLESSTDIELKILRATSTVTLEGRHLNISQIKDATGKSLRFEMSNDDKHIQIDLGGGYKANETVTLSIDYLTTWNNETDPNNIWGSQGKGVRFFKPSTTEPHRQKQLWTANGPEGNSYWFPSIHSAADYRTTELKVTVEKPLKVIGNGHLVSKTDNGDGTQTFHWQTDVPHAPHLTSFVAGRYIAVTQDYDGVDINSYCYPHEIDATAATVERLPDMMRYFSKITGVKYPYPSYSQVFVQEFARWQGGLMTATITENMVDDYVTHKDFFYLWDIVESEALAGQWFGTHLTPEKPEDAWLAKGFARYLSGLYSEYKNGKEEYLVYQYNPQVTTYFTDWAGGTIQPVQNKNYEDVTAFDRSNHVSLHAASILHMLRKQLGDDAWFRILKTYTQEFAGKTVTTNDLKAVTERISGKNLDDFFQKWVYQVGHPVFEVEKHWDVNSTTLNLTVKQTQQWDTLQTAHETSGFFGGKLWVEMDGEIHEIQIQPKAENRYEFALKSRPSFVNFDFESNWVKQLTYERSTEEWISTLNHSKDILARVNALGQLGAKVNQKGVSDADKENVFASIRSVILDDNSYWRLKMLALWQLQGLMLNADGTLDLDEDTETMLLSVINRDQGWVKSSAVWFLGMSQDPKYAQLYIDLFEDWSDRVTNAAAIALGKTKSPKAYDALMQLPKKPSWKNQSLISALNGLQWLGDERGKALALHSLANNEDAHWTLATPIWDHRLAASLTLAALESGQEGFGHIESQIQKAIKENDLNDLLYNAQQLVNLADERGTSVFEKLQKEYEHSPKILSAINQLAQQLKASLK